MNSPVEIQSINPLDDGTYQSFITVDRGSMEQIQTLVEQSTTVSDVSLIAERDDGSLFSCRMTGTTVATVLADYGAIPRRVVAESNRVRVVGDVPQGTDIGAFVHTFTGHYFEAELVARREHNRNEQTQGAFIERLNDRLTDRQQEVLQLAYLSGFFEWPRDTTGEELADSLDIVPSTLHQHLRAGQRKLVAVMVEESLRKG